MVELQILSGSRAGTKFVANHFPVRVGREKDLELSVDEPGVWPRHFQIAWESEALVVEVEQDALLSVNDAPVRRSVLRNGDIITLGSLKMRFRLSAIRQFSTVPREWLTWFALGALCLAQVALVYLLLRL